MTTRTQPQSDPGSLRRTTRIHPELLALVVSIAASLLVGTLVMREPLRIERLGVRNLTEHRVTISTRAPHGLGRTPVIFVWPGEVEFARDVVDEGAVWWLLIDSNTSPHRVEVEVTRAELAAAGWVYTVPASIWDAPDDGTGDGTDPSPAG